MNAARKINVCKWLDEVDSRYLQFRTCTYANVVGRHDLLFLFPALLRWFPAREYDRCLDALTLCGL